MILRRRELRRPTLGGRALVAFAALFLFGLDASWARPATPPAAASTARTDEFDDLLARVARGDEPALQSLLAMGEEAAVRASVPSPGEDVVMRRARARVVERAGGPRVLDAVLAACADPDPIVRASYARFLSRPTLARARADRRVEQLAAFVRADPDAAVRAAGVRSLTEIDAADALAVLDRCLDDLAGEERAAAAGELARTLRGRALSAARLARAVDGREDPRVYAALLVPYARALADLVEAAPDPSAGAGNSPSIAISSAARQPIVAALRHPDPRVRGAGAAAYDALATRLFAQRKPERVQAVLAALQSDGVAPERVLVQRARVAMHAGDTALALELSRALEVVAAAGDDTNSRILNVRAATIASVARFARGELDAARAAWSVARERTRALLGERRDMATRDGARVQAELLLCAAALEMNAALFSIATVIPALDPATSASPTAAVPEPTSVPDEALFALRRAHALALEAQLVAWRGDLDGTNDLDRLIGDPDGVLELVLDPGRHAAWPANRGVALRRGLGRALATVVPTEVVGFAPYPVPTGLVADPLEDPERSSLLVRLGVADTDRLARALSKKRQHALRASLDDPAGLDPEEKLALLEAEYRWYDALEAQKRVSDGRKDDLLELRAPVSYVIDLGRLLRDEGRPAEARDLLVKARDAFEQSAVAQRFLWGLAMRAQVEIALGGTYSDGGDPKQAEIELSKAVARLEALETTLAERGANRGAMAMIRSERCNALVALAVNANVKLRDPKQAIVWFERAWELRQDEFMRVLYACYRARDGRELEARALLVDVTPGPNVDYNLACTYALLGERELAFEYLRRELDLDQPSPGVRARQAEWARTDPDLESLRDDPRFEVILKGRP